MAGPILAVFSLVFVVAFIDGADRGKHGVAFISIIIAIILGAMAVMTPPIVGAT